MEKLLHKNIRTKKKHDTMFFSVYTFTVAEQLINLDDKFLENLETSKNFLENLEISKNFLKIKDKVIKEN